MKIKNQEDVDILDDEIEIVMRKFSLPKTFITKTKKKNKKMRKQIKNKIEKELYDK